MYMCVCVYIYNSDKHVNYINFNISDNGPCMRRYHVTDAVLDGGIAFNKAYGMSIFDYNSREPRFSKVFNQCMTGHSNITLKKILETYNGFQGLSSIVDVGGGSGATLNMIVSKYPAIKGINFDLPHVVRDSPSIPGMKL